MKALQSHKVSRDRSSERGAVLLTTLLIMSIMAVLAVVMIEDILLAIKRTAHIEGEAQASWYMQGADDYSQTYLAGVVAADNPEAANVALLSGVDAVFPLDNGSMAVSIRDGSNCLSLGLLDQEDGSELFTILFQTLGFNDQDAAIYAARLTDWVDADETPLPRNGAEDFHYLGLESAYRTANAPFSSVYEIRALGIFEEAEFQFLRPFICAHKPSTTGTPTQVNLNTLTPEQAPLLAVALGSAEHLQLALTLISNRPATGWPDLGSFWAAPELEDFEQNDSFASLLMGTQPHHIWVDVTVLYQAVQKRAAFEYRINNDAIEKTYRYFGDEAHWPRPINLLEAGDE